MNKWNLPSITIVAAMSIASLSAAAFGAPSAEGGVPDFTGPWNNTNAWTLLPASHGPKPPDALAGYPHLERGLDAQGKDISGTGYVGNYRSPLLTPWGRNILKGRAEAAITGHDPFWPGTDCYLYGPTAVIEHDPVTFIRHENEITITYQRDDQFRHVYLNAPHSKKPKPSWYGESIAHYEGDTLVVDTIGYNERTPVDRFGIPHSGQLHTIERYRMSPDRKRMDLEITYDDPKAFTREWTAVSHYRKVRAAPLEVVCAESPIDPATGESFPIPVAQRADF
jgi:hypothetical protein